jgi:hypothetical protein
MILNRIDKTMARLRAGELPPPPAVRTLMDSNKETVCSGCGEVIGVFERYYYTRIRKVTSFSFHLSCHEAWIRFRQQSTHESVV